MFLVPRANADEVGQGVGKGREVAWISDVHCSCLSTVFVNPSGKDGIMLWILSECLLPSLPAFCYGVLVKLRDGCTLCRVAV